MRIAIMGSGGVGAYYGARLVTAGNAVTFIARGEHLAAIRSQGLRVTSIKGDMLLKEAAATDDPAAVGPVDLVLVCVKTWQLEAAARAMRPMIGPDTAVLPLLNGVEAYEQLKTLLPQGIVLGGLTRILSFIAGPGHIRHTSIEPYIGLGSMDGAHQEQARRIVSVLTAAGIQAEIPGDLSAAIWAKFQFVCAWGSVGAVTRAPIGAIRAIAETRALVERCLDEIGRVARSRAVALKPELAARQMTFIDALDPESTTSLQRDVAAGRPSELDAWTGAVVRLGRASGVETPVHAMIYAALLPQERAARSVLQR